MFLVCCWDFAGADADVSAMAGLLAGALFISRIFRGKCRLSPSYYLRSITACRAIWGLSWTPSRRRRCIGFIAQYRVYTSETRAARSRHRQGTREAARKHWHDAVANATSRHIFCRRRLALRFPPLSNSFIFPTASVKDTSLAATIQVPVPPAQLISTSRTLEVFTMYLAASLIYWVMATVLSALQKLFLKTNLTAEREPK